MIGCIVFSVVILSGFFKVVYENFLCFFVEIVLYGGVFGNERCGDNVCCYDGD